ncbi:MAG TPA: hypothetical protein PLY23_02730 [Alphaproteobacteria bacterium]|nr:hypothetical protein [Alphaproteobacteria bacterium]HQS93690.1 hypothetical protein [Alphaproteobacteria bacterium]
MKKFCFLFDLRGQCRCRFVGLILFWSFIELLSPACYASFRRAGVEIFQNVGSLPPVRRFSQLSKPFSSQALEVPPLPKLSFYPSCRQFSTVSSPGKEGSENGKKSFWSFKKSVVTLMAGGVAFYANSLVERIEEQRKLWMKEAKEQHKLRTEYIRWYLEEVALPDQFRLETNPQIFISYSWGTDKDTAHVDVVHRLGYDLKRVSKNALLDIEDNPPFSDLYEFAGRISDSDSVLLMATSLLKQKCEGDGSYVVKEEMRLIRKKAKTNAGSILTVRLA